MEGRRLTLADKWILSRFNEAVKVISNNLDEYDTGNAAQKIYDFAWSEFCDWYIELAKPRLLGDDEESRDTARAVLEYVLIGMLKLLHPFMPFLTDAVYRYLPGTEGTIMRKKLARVQSRVRVRRRKRADAGHHGRDRMPCATCAPL